ncbi:MAG: aldehyde dehydrogenase [Candidatus Gallimonas sp.]
MNTDEILERQRAFFQSGKTLPVRFRIGMLKKLRDCIKRREKQIAAALYADLGKSAYESYMCETGLALSEIGFMIRHIRKFAKEKRASTPLSQFPARSYQKPSPYGNVLVMSPWNYPFLLSIDPLADAIAAGNTVVLKPSAYSPATGEVIAEIVAECFPPEYVAVVTGGRKENAELLDCKFDLVFFTGSKNVGKEVLRRCAERLTPAVLELGGKSPCIVDETAKIPLAAKRIVFGKFLNCGQTCVAPDYVLCDRVVKDELIKEIVAQLKAQFGERPLENPDYGKLIGEKHFERVRALIDPEKTAFGGGCDRAGCRIEPTVLDGVSWEDPVMQEEIFGPVLPVLTFEKFDEVYSLLADRPAPLALYLFTQDGARARAVTERCTFGGGCVNDVVVHLATSRMGFGGVGESGMGAYHGEAGFYAFSHVKSIVDKSVRLDLPMRYQPYEKKYEKLVRRFLR